MRNIISDFMLACVIGLSAAAAAPSVSLAQSLELELGREGPRMRVIEECDPAFEDCRPRRGERRLYREERRVERGCTEDRALDKAERMGLRRARIVDAGRRTIDVRGRDRFGDRVIVTFGRQPGCPVLR